SNTWGRNSGIYPLSFSLLRHGGRCFVFAARSLVLGSLLKSFSHYVQAIVPGGIVIALVVYSIFHLCPIFALSLNFFPTLIMCSIAASAPIGLTEDRVK